MTAEVVSCSLVAYPEVRSAFARARRERRLTASRHTTAVAALDHDWRTYLRIPPTSRLVRLAGNLVDKYPLKGYDAVDLACAMSLRDKIPEPVVLSVWDAQLRRAALAEGFQVAHHPTA